MHLITIVFIVLVIGGVVGKYQQQFGARNQVRKLRQELRERGERD